MTVVITSLVGDLGAQPEWAGLQLGLVERIRHAIPEFVARYTRSDGSLIWRDHWAGIDGSDDPYEGFMYIALFGAITGDEAAIASAHRMWDAITWQWTQYGQLDREFDRQYDWMHHGEGNLFHYFFGLADPGSVKQRQRAARFVRMYDGSDPLAPNFDPDRTLVRSPQTGSAGPLFFVEREHLSTHREVLNGYPAPFDDLAGIDPSTGRVNWLDDEVYDRILALMNERTTRGDVPLNLSSTGLFTHAFMYDADPRKRDWVLEYLAAWERRAEKNGGTIPDNVGLSGAIGENLGGRWWGGHYGWRWPHGWSTIIEPVLNACLNAYLLTGDASNLRLLRDQLDRAWGRRRDTGGTPQIPHKYTDNGWSDYRPMNPMPAIHLWAATRDDVDAERVERVRRDEDDWSSVRVPTRPFSTKHFNANLLPWFEYQRGRSSDHPLRMLRAGHALLDQQLRRMRSTDGDPRRWHEVSVIDGVATDVGLHMDGYAIHAWQEFSPIYFESLVQTLLGTPAHNPHGGLQFATVRAFDPARRAAGLPPGMALLVGSTTTSTVHLEIAYHPTDPTDVAAAVTIQAGGFSEHEFTSLRIGDGVTEPLEPTSAVELHVSAGSTARITLGMRRFARTPSYATPFTARDDWDPILRGRDVEESG